MAKNTETEKKAITKSNKKKTDIDNSTDTAPQKKDIQKDIQKNKSRPVPKKGPKADENAQKTDRKKATGEASPEANIKKDTGKPHPKPGRRRRPHKSPVSTNEPPVDTGKAVEQNIDFDIFIDTGNDIAADSAAGPIEKNGMRKDTDNENITVKLTAKRRNRKKTIPKAETPELPAPSAVAEKEIDEATVEKKTGPSKGGRRFYDPAEYVAVQMMNSLAGFAPLGLLFVLMDVLNGAEEGLIRVNRLAASLGIGKPAMLAQLENLEKAGLIRTVSSSQRGRHVELLVPNLVICRRLEEVRTAQEISPMPAIPRGAPKNFSLERLRALYAWLSERGIRVVSLPDESDLDPKLAGIAAFLGKYLSFVQPFYSRLKTTLGDGEEVQFSLLGFQGRDVTHTLNFCKMLQDAGMLSAFTYRRAPHYKIVARLNRTPEAINFLSGGWLEHYIRDRVVAILAAHPATHDTPFAFMKNPRIILPGDEDFEFDFLLMVGEKVFWIEAKTGDYLEYLAKYSRVSRLMGLGRDNNLLVLVDAPPPDAHISARYGLNCCSVEEFAEVFRISLVRELGKHNRRSR